MSRTLNADSRQIVYIVLRGSYSDLEILGVMSSVNRAQQFVDECIATDYWRRDRSEYDIACWPLDDMSAVYPTDAE